LLGPERVHQLCRKWRRDRRVGAGDDAGPRFLATSNLDGDQDNDLVVVNERSDLSGDMAVLLN